MTQDPSHSIAGGLDVLICSPDQHLHITGVSLCLGDGQGPFFRRWGSIGPMVQLQHISNVHDPWTAVASCVIAWVQPRECSNQLDMRLGGHQGPRLGRAEDGRKMEPMGATDHVDLCRLREAFCSYWACVGLCQLSPFVCRRHDAFGRTQPP